MSAVKRVQKHLDKPLRSTPSRKHASLHSRVEALKKAGATTNEDGVVVTVLATGKAIEKVTQIAAWFEEKGEYVVKLQTGSVSALDDIKHNSSMFEEETRVRQLSSLQVKISLR